MKNTTVVPIQQVDLLDVLFAHRNRTYGAYLLRRDYPQHLARAMIIGFSLILAALALIAFALRVSKTRQTSLEGEAIVCFTDFKVPQAKPLTPSPRLPRTALPPAVRSSMRFVPPVVQPDNMVLDGPATHTQDQLVTSDLGVGVANVSGNPEAPPSLSPSDLSVSGSGLVEHPASAPVYESFDVQKMPSFPGGEAELLKYLSREIRYPVLARDSGVEGPVVLSLVIDQYGQVGEIQLLKDPGAGLGKEAIRVVSSMPTWFPGEANGHPVKVRFYLPIRFELN